jgi:hypothetical protein
VIRENTQPAPPCPVCAVRRAVYLVLKADKAGDHPVPDLADLLHRTLDAVTALHRFNLATNPAAAEARAVKAADALATLYGDLLDLSAVHDDEQCIGGH